MILPIVSYGHPSLRRQNAEIGPDYPNLKALIENMYETMYQAQGVGLAAPQVNIPIRLFVVDGSPMEDLDGSSLEGFKKVFINPKMGSEAGEVWPFEEGCLSIPDIREDVRRPGDIVITYQDEQFETHTESFSGLRARIIQHEYDHLEGILFTDHISQLRRRMLKSRLNKISKGQIDTTYPMKFPV
ncbi:MAG: peptide deformylase [Bacteroidetes bacterium]|nr:MAG: peptide deformylase [Bacteroidota bacterium]